MDNSNQTAVILLAAGSIKNKYSSYSFLYNSPALIPVASRSCASYIIDFYLQHSVNICLVINKEDEQDVASDLIGYPSVKIVCVQNTKGINDTLQQAIEYVSEESVIVNVITTVPLQLPAVNTVYIENTLAQNKNYSGIRFRNKDILFKSKGDGSEEKSHAFLGLLHAQTSAVKAAIKKVSNGTDLLELVKALSIEVELQFEQTEWIDIGHEINYVDARKKMLASRVFNTISVNNSMGILTKQSSNKTKLANEVSYVGMLPKQLQILYPRIVLNNEELGSVVMEYYGYPNLSEYQLYRTIEPAQWEKVFSMLRQLLIHMKGHQFSIGKNSHTKFYYDKIVSRVEDFYATTDKADSCIHKDETMVNGVACKSFHLLQQQVKQRVDNLYKEEDFCIMHGDLCFNNILFDVFSNTLKLIDPRGSFGDGCVGIYGDVKYDLAKLLHSSVAHYDYIVNNLFKYAETKDGIEYSFPLRTNQSLLQELSFKLVKELGYNENDLMFIVGLLFLSMCSLHPGNKNRQKLMYFHGLYLVNKHL